MALGEGYLPPVVGQIIADSADFIAKLQEAKRLGEAFDRSEYSATLSVRSEVATELARMDAEIYAWIDKQREIAVGVDDEATAEIPKIIADMNAIAKASPVEVPVKATTDNKSFLASLGASLAAGGLLKTLGWGGGGGIPGLGWGAGMASFGSPLGLAGLGVEHVVTTILGLAGSAAGGAAGGGLLALGSLGKLAVGGGSDMAVMKSTIADTKTLFGDYNNLSNAIKDYGANSTQAQQATQQLNNDMKNLGNTAGVQAELGLAKLAVTLNTQWDLATSNARVQAVGILTQVLHLGQTYVPLVAAAAERNLSIINTGIKPLFSWLEGPSGKGIFADLENMFAKELPTALDAFTQGVELFIKVVDDAAQHTGGFMTSLDGLLTRWNSAAYADRLSSGIGKLIGMFHVWMGLIKQIGITLFDIFDQSLGLGTSIVSTLTQMLVQLDAWLTSTQGKASMHSLFQVHLDEVLQILKLLPTLVAGFGSFYMTAAPAFTTALVDILKVLNPLLEAMVKMPFGPWIIGLGVLAWRLGILGTLMKPVVDGMKSLALGAINATFGTSLGGKSSAAEVMAGAADVQAEAANVMSAAVTRFAETVGFEGIGGGVGKIAGPADSAAVKAGVPLAEWSALGGVGAGGAGAAEAGGAAAAEAGGAAAGGMSLATVGGLIGAAVAAGLVGGKVGNVIGGKIGGSTGAGWGGLIGATATGGLVGAGAEIATSADTRNAIGDMFSDIGTFFHGIPGFLGSAKTNIKNTVGDFFNGVGTFFHTLNWYQLGVATRIAIGNMFSAIGTFFDGQRQALASMLTGVKNSVGGMFSAIGTFFDGQRQALGSMTASIKSNIGNFFKNIGTFFSTFNFETSKTSVKNAAGSFFSAIGTFFDGQRQALFSMFAGVKNAVGNFFNALGSYVAGLTGRGGGGTLTGYTNMVARAVGGPVVAGGTYVIGEAGAPEVLHMFTGGGGYVTPLVGGGVGGVSGGSSKNSFSVPISVNVMGSATPQTAQQIGQVISQIVQREMSQMVRQLNSGAYATVPS